MNEPYSFQSGYDSWDKEGLNCDKNDPLEKIPYYPGAEPINNQTLCMYAQHSLGAHYDVHSLFSLYESKATFETLQHMHGGQIRPWVLSRGNVAGQGRWSFHWTGKMFLTT